MFDLHLVWIMNVKYKEISHRSNFVSDYFIFSDFILFSFLFLMFPLVLDFQCEVCSQLLSWLGAAIGIKHFYFQVHLQGNFSGVVGASENSITQRGQQLY